MSRVHARRIGARIVTALAVGSVLVASAATAQDAGASSDYPAGLMPVHPDESVQATLGERFSFGNALASTARMRSILTSFEALAYEVRGKVDPRRLAEIGNTDTETLTLGCRNLPGNIEGALRLQDWTIRKLRWELAVERLKQGLATEEQVRGLKRELDEADAAFRSFWSGFGIGE